MSLVRRLARPLLAAPLVAGGVESARHPAMFADNALPLAKKAAAPVGLPQDPEVLVRAVGATQAGAGVLFALGRFPRLSALLLALTLAPTAYVKHPFWTESDPERKRTATALFLKDLGLLGGVVIAAVDTQGRPGLAWRSRHAVQHANTSARRAKREAKLAARSARTAAKAEAKAVARSAKAATAVLPG